MTERKTPCKHPLTYDVTLMGDTHRWYACLACGDILQGEEMLCGSLPLSGASPIAEGESQ